MGFDVLHNWKLKFASVCKSVDLSPGYRWNLPSVKNPCCKWTRAIATLPPTRFCENYCQIISTCKWLLRAAIVVKSIALKFRPCEWLMRFDFLGGVSGNVFQNFMRILLRVSDLRDLRKKKSKIPILAAKSRPCECSCRPTDAKVCQRDCW